MEIIKKKYKILIGIGILAVFFLTQVVGFLTDFWWFQSLGKETIFLKVFESETTLFVVGFLGFWFLLEANSFFLNRIVKKNQLQSETIVVNLDAKLFSIVAKLVTIFVAFLAGSFVSDSYQTILLYANGENFGQLDPIFQKDIGFYFFHLPFYKLLIKWFTSLLFIALIYSIGVYFLKGQIYPERGWRNIVTDTTRNHIAVLLVLIAVLFSIGYGLDKYDILYSPTGVVYGAGYTDVNAGLQGYYVLIFATALIAAAFVASMFLPSGGKLILGAVGFYVAVLLVFKGVYPWMQQKFIVEPNELTRETPYIKNNIEMTRKAYNLHEVKKEKYEVSGSLTLADMKKNEGTFENVRLWDHRPLLSNFKQVQEMRLYYEFHDVDIDRYQIDNKSRQVMLSARELAYEKVPEQAKTWDNQRLRYTHGYGVVMSPVNEISPEGMPRFYIQDIPPVAKKELKLTRPEIYYGEKTNHYIFTGTSTQEFDYPMGDTNQYTHYAGEGGVALNSFFRKVIHAIGFKSFKILISEYMTAATKIHHTRNILERVNKLAPFLAYDSDPYIVLVDGRIFWVLDGYTISNRYPYSTPTRGGQFNYIRNSVKVVVDAYHGSVKFYVVDEKDPLLKAYSKIFPKLFDQKSSIPVELKKHFRYPVDMFMVQADIYRVYHMSDTRVFYNREDAWNFPNEIYEASEQQVEPYYVNMRLPDQPKEEFLLFMPFTPFKKDNMISWMAASSDGDRYGELTVYEFPKKEIVYGPKQIEARIDQTPKISEQLTLWSQKGSKVIRGNLLTFPVQNTLLYVEPLYIRAASGQIPELKRVIVAYGKEAIVMEDTLERALEVLFGKVKQSDVGKESRKADVKTLIQTAIRLYEQSEAALKSGSWAKYGELQQELKSILTELNRNVP